MPPFTIPPSTTPMNQNDTIPSPSPSPSNPSQTFTAANLNFFNSLASTYSTLPWQQRLSFQVTTFIQQHLPLINIPSNPSISLLDYASGTGLISRALCPPATSITAIDLSPNMIERYRTLASESEHQALRNARAAVGNLLADEIEEEVMGEGFWGFDVVAVGVGMHHFDDAALAVRRLVERLRVGGVLVVVDFVEEEQVGKSEGEGEGIGHGHGHGHGSHEDKRHAHSTHNHGNHEHDFGAEAERTIRRNGFKEHELREMMQSAGLGGFGWMEMEERLEIWVNEDKPVTRKGFLARGMRL